MIKNKTAIILAGGEGERLRPYTLVLPKPLMPLGENPIAEILIKKLAKEGFQKIILAVNYRDDLIKSFFEKGLESLVSNLIIGSGFFLIAIF